MDADFSWFHDLLGVNLYPFNISILVFAIQKEVPIETGEVILVKVTAFPSFLRNYLLSLVVYVENGGRQRFASFIIERPKHTSVTKIMLIQVQVGILSQGK